MKPRQITLVILIMMLLSGCAAQQLISPCPNFGAHCQKIPLNTGDANSAVVNGESA